jgi:HAD superfamily hydrolase (TIGR01509 family)
MTDKLQNNKTGKTLIIFDCDGTLVNTEFLSADSYATSLHSISDELKKYDAAALEKEFKGMQMGVSAQILIDRYALKTSTEEIILGYMQQAKINRAAHQEIIPGVKESLEKISKDERFELCVASNGEYENIVASLEQAQLLEYFSADRIFDASMVAAPKPSPLLFLHAAKTCGFEGQDCIVVEDTSVGTRAGKAAGYFVYGFTGCVADEHKLIEETALKNAKADKVFRNFIHIADDIMSEESDSYLMSA